MASEILIAGSLAWIIIWSILGLIVGSGVVPWLGEMKELAKAGNLENFWASLDEHRQKKTAHAHATSLSCVALLVGLLFNFDLVGYSSTFLLILAIGILVGIILASIGDRFRITPVIAAGSILFLTGLIITFVGLFL